MKILDSNIIIYSAKAQYNFLKTLVFDRNNAISSITKVEVLGFPDLSIKDKTYFEHVMSRLNVLHINSPIIDKAIELKQEKKVGVQDAIIAATAWLYDIELVTRNSDDFKHINDITISNPVD
jgi:toxin FitB